MSRTNSGRPSEGHVDSLVSAYIEQIRRAESSDRPEDFADAVQASAVRVLTKSTYDKSKPFGAYFEVIVSHQKIDDWRRERTRRAAESRYATESLLGSAKTPAADELYIAEETLKAFKSELVRRSASLSSGDLRILKTLSGEESVATVAKALGISPANAFRRRKLLMRKIGRELEPFV